jgi:hypothetical protein
MGAAQLFFIALLISATNAEQDPCSADKNNGFELSSCGEGGNKVCCHPVQQVCLSGKPKEGDEQFECSSNRAFYGMKVVTVLIIPICSCIYLLVAAGIMISNSRKLKHHGRRWELALLCSAQAILSIFVVFSMWWKFALYSSFMAVIVFYMMQVKGHTWVLVTIVVLQIFNLLATLGAYGTSGTFVPLGLLSADNVKSFEQGAIDAAIASSTGCSAYYGNYFTVESVELMNEGADPLVKYYGYCGDGWMVTVAAFIAFKAVIQLFMLVLSLQLLGKRLGHDVSDHRELKSSD